MPTAMELDLYLPHLQLFKTPKQHMIRLLYKTYPKQESNLKTCECYTAWKAVSAATYLFKYTS